MKECVCVRSAQRSSSWMVKFSEITFSIRDTGRPTSLSPTGMTLRNLLFHRTVPVHVNVLVSLLCRRVLCVKEIGFVGHFNKEWECLLENFLRPPAVVGNELKIYCKVPKQSRNLTCASAAAGVCGCWFIYALVCLYFRSSRS